MTRGTKLRRTFLAAEIVDEDFEEVTLDVGVFAEKMDRRDDVHRLSKRGAVGNNDG